MSSKDYVHFLCKEGYSSVRMNIVTGSVKKCTCWWP
ncbi:hypothetical protein LINPERPRIM_LOCUS7973 [Linum perenne]